MRHRWGSKLKESVKISPDRVRVQAILLLGSNIQPESHLPRAARELARKFRVLQASQVWETPAVGSAGPRFLNAGLLVETEIGPEAIKHEVLRPLEASLGRLRTSDKYAPRSIDIDLIAWGDEVCEPHIWELAYAAVPAAELCPDLRLERTGESLVQAAARLKRLQQITPRPDVVLFD